MKDELKKAAENITLPEDAKERIIAACEKYAESGSTSGNIEYTESVSGVESVSSNRRILRIVGSLAACAVIVGSAAAAINLMNKRKPDTPSDTMFSQVTDKSEGSPFTELFSKAYNMSAPEKELTPKMRADIAELFASMEWTETDEYNVNSTLHEELCLSWKSDDMNIYLSICSDYRVVYTISRTGSNGLANEQHNYNIEDYNELIGKIFDIVWNAQTPFGSLLDYDIEEQCRQSYGIDYLTLTQKASLGNYFGSLEWNEMDGPETDESEWGKAPYYFVKDDGSGGTILVYDSDMLAYQPGDISSVKWYSIDSDEVLEMLDRIVLRGEEYTASDFNLKVGEVDDMGNTAVTSVTHTTAETTTVTTVSAVMTETETETDETAASDEATINAYIECVSAFPKANGFTCYLCTEGSYAEYTYEVYAKTAMDSSFELLSSGTSSESRIELTSSSIGVEFNVIIASFNSNGELGEKMTFSYNTADSSMNEIESCSRSGYIAAPGSSPICGYATSYIVNNYDVAYERTDLMGGWHIIAVGSVIKDGTKYYALYDADDGDYYGWVPESSLTFTAQETGDNS